MRVRRRHSFRWEARAVCGPHGVRATAGAGGGLESVADTQAGSRAREFEMAIDLKVF